MRRDYPESTKSSSFPPFFYIPWNSPQQLHCSWSPTPGTRLPNPQLQKSDQLPYQCPAHYPSDKHTTPPMLPRPQSRWSSSLSSSPETLHWDSDPGGYIEHLFNRLSLQLSTGICYTSYLPPSLHYELYFTVENSIAQSFPPLTSDRS